MISGKYQYHEIIQRPDYAAAERWGENALAPYLSVDNPGSAEDLFIPYANPRSIKEKVRYAAERGLAGLMIWELRGDYLPDGSHPLLKALKEEYQAQHGSLPGEVRIGPHFSPSAQD